MISVSFQLIAELEWLLYCHGSSTVISLGCFMDRTTALSLSQFRWLKVELLWRRWQCTTDPSSLPFWLLHQCLSSPIPLCLSTNALPVNMWRLPSWDPGNGYEVLLLALPYIMDPHFIVLNVSVPNKPGLLWINVHHVFCYFHLYIGVCIIFSINYMYYGEKTTIQMSSWFKGTDHKAFIFISTHTCIRLNRGMRLHHYSITFIIRLNRGMRLHHYSITFIILPLTITDIINLWLPGDTRMQNLYSSDGASVAIMKTVTSAELMCSTIRDCKQKICFCGGNITSKYRLNETDWIW